ncbi:MAG: SRPBCC family protein [Fibrobacterota bacterium]
MILLALVLLALVVLVLVVSNKSAYFRIERSRVISAADATIHSRIDDFRQWTKWSPWEGLDPNLTRDYSGAESGMGAVYSWSGNGKAGAGRMTILSSDSQAIVMNLEFLRPFKATNTTTFRLEPQSAGTKVTWTMEGNNGFMLKLFSLVFNTEKLVGKDFEKGLAAIAESVEPKT